MLGRALGLLKHVHAVSVPVLTKEFGGALLEEAKQYPLRPARNSVGNSENRVYQDMLLQDRLQEDGLFDDLVVGFQNLFDAAIANDSPFCSPVVFNDVMLQKYEVGSGGITPHRDRTDYRHIICLFVLAGLGRFYVADDRRKSNAIEVANLPGDVVLMPGPGFSDLAERPFHYLEDISEERWVFGLRHDQSKLTDPAHKHESEKL